ncbi:MAG: DUF2304 domain-containing protein [Bacteroidales bacterium]|nr:DUF2304 domain-containing protein [Bacteroidales bacterium]
MGTTVKILALLYSLVLFGAFIVMARNKSVKPFYSTLWLIVSIFMLSFVIFEGFYRRLAEILQIENATIFVIVGLISFLLIYVLHLSVKISELSNRIQELISHNSILERELRIIRQNKDTEETED